MSIIFEKVGISLLSLLCKAAVFLQYGTLFVFYSAIKKCEECKSAAIMGFTMSRLKEQ